ncbi:MAG: peptide deformylase [Deltaproteobacteria bacterium]|nr:peptide deformylase [Deltaproteobacteria bacterium]MBN2687113.1 peptide deformylase [Deltaproteobacteria bacterium]
MMTNKKTWKLWENDRVNEEETKLLRRKADELPLPFDEDGKRDIRILIESFLRRDDALGLAAPQIGISKQIVVFKNKQLDERGRVKNEKDFDVLINPRITQIRGDKETATEGCLSCPDVSVEVSRHTEIKVKAYDRQGKKINKRYTGFLARVVQHEIDHLEGKLIIDHDGSIYVPRERQKFFNDYFKE